MIYKVNDEIRIRLKHPLGKLIVGPPEKTINVLKQVIEREKPTKLIVIGDVVTSNILSSGLKVDFIVIVFKTKREPVKPFSLDDFEVLRVKNPPSMITDETYSTVREACARLVQGGNAIAVIVDGEEDLITLPVVKFAPLHSLIVYGQPNVGIVLLNVTDRARQELETIIDRMTTLKSC